MEHGRLGRAEDYSKAEKKDTGDDLDPVTYPSIRDVVRKKKVLKMHIHPSQKKKCIDNCVYSLQG